MNVKYYLVLSVMFFTTCAISATIPNKLNILLVDVGTIDTVAKTEKYLMAVDKSATATPPMPIAADHVVDPELQKQAVRINWLTGMAEYYKTKADIQAENARKRKILEGLRNSMVGNSQNRLIVIAKDYLASGLETYSDFIAVVDRSDASLSEVEKAISNKSQEEVAPATLFLSVTLGDLQHVTKNLQVGDARVVQNLYTRKATAKVSDFNNVRIYSCDVTAKYNNRGTDAVSVSGEENVIAEHLIEDAMKQIAAKVGEKFVRSFVVKVNIPKSAKEDIDADSVDFEMDGQPVSVGDSIRALAIDHIITAKLEDEKFGVYPASIRVGANKTKAVFKIKSK